MKNGSLLALESFTDILALVESSRSDHIEETSNLMAQISADLRFPSNKYFSLQYIFGYFDTQKEAKGK
jgi:hypothetical protein